MIIKKIYWSQVGAFADRKNAERLAFYFFEPKQAKYGIIGHGNT